MNPIPARLMRAQVEACPNRPRPTERERNRRDYILDAATRIFTTYGRFRVTLREIAIATGLTQTAIRNQIADIDHLFALILARHLDAILSAIGAISHGQPNLQARRRAEYLRLTRGFLNVPTPLHFLWLRERFILPEDELEPLEERLRLIGAMLAGDAGQTALLLLDSPHLDAGQIETMLIALTPAVGAPSAEAPQNSPTARANPEIPPGAAAILPRPARFNFPAALAAAPSPPPPAPLPQAPPPPDPLPQTPLPQTPLPQTMARPIIHLVPTQTGKPPLRKPPVRTAPH